MSRIVYEDEKERMAERMKGEKNPRWNGGISEYPNHAEMKRNRLQKLKEAKNKCEVCGEEAFCIHHLDGSVDNHSMNNLAVLCKRCHHVLHAGRREVNFSDRPKTSKYIREYGMTLKQMMEQFGGSITRYRNMHQRGELKNFLEKLKERKNENSSAEPGGVTSEVIS